MQLAPPGQAMAELEQWSLLGRRRRVSPVTPGGESANGKALPPWLFVPLVRLRPMYPTTISLERPELGLTYKQCEISTFNAAFSANLLSLSLGESLYPSQQRSD